MRAFLSIVAIAAVAAAAPDASDPRCKGLDTACADFFLAVQCDTVRPCIPRWERLVTPLGNDTELCATCKKMVQEARDNLLSNMTQDELREVLEGSCDVLIPIAPFNGMCKKLMEAFQDQLNDVLVSRMDPTQVCTVSGLCWKPESSDIEQRASELFLSKSAQKTCTTCRSTLGKVVEITKFVPRIDIVQAFSDVCQNAGFDKTKCDTFAQTYVAKFIHNFHSMPTEKTCQFFGRCQGFSRPMAVGPADNLECEFCEAMIHKVVVQFNNTSAKQQVKTVLENICKHTGSWAAECLQRIDDDFDKAYDELISMLDPVTVCSMAGICNGKQRLRTLPMATLTPAKHAGPRTVPMAKLTPAKYAAAKPLAQAPTILCEECQQIAEYLVAAVNNNRCEENIKAVLEKVCEVIPMDVATCQQYVDTNMDQLYDLLRQEVTVDHICKSLRLCAANVAPLAASEKNLKNHCGLCGMIVNYLIDELKSNSTDAAILSALEKVCSVLPVDKVSCRNTIDTYGGIIIALIQEEVAADVICATIGLCAGPKAMPKSDDCSLCQLVTGFLIDELKDNKTDAAIVSALEKVCRVVPVDATECKNTIDTYGKLIISMINSNVTPDEICAAVGLCRSRRVPIVADRCAICQTVAGFLVDELKDNKTDAAILAALDKVCNVVPVDKVECRNTINTYGGLLISLLQQDANADEICAALGLCATNVRVVQPRATNYCQICKTITDFLIDELKDNKTDAAIVAALEKVCKVVPVDAVQCKNTVDTYGNMIIEMIKNNVSANEICTSIGYCSVRRDATGTPNQYSGSQACPMCQIVVHVVEAELQNNNTQKEIETILEDACSLLPRKDRIPCRNMINVYTAYIIDMLGSLASAEQICQTLSYCPTPPTTPKCEVCLFVTNWVESRLGDNRTEAEIEKALSEVCDYLPNMDVPQCKETVYQFSDMIITLLLQTVPPRKICEEFKLCPLSAKLVAALPKEEPQQQPASEEQCTFCKWLVTWVDNKLQENRTQAVIIAELDKACDLLSDSGKCKDLVNDYVDMIVKMIIEYAEPEKICESIKKCPKQKVANDEPPCRYCRYVIDELRGDIESSEAELKAKLDGVCGVIPVDAAECQSFVNRYADQIVALILNNTDPEKICEILGVCPKKIKAVSDKCAFCEEVLQFVVAEVNDETTDEEIVALVEKVCRFAPLIHREDCHRMIEIEGLVIVRMIAESLDPKSICDVIRYCPDRNNKGRLVCAWCQYALHSVQEKLYDNSTQQAIRERLEEMCSRLPQPEMSGECKEFVDVYGPSLEVILAQDLDPSIICPAIHACPARKPIAIGGPSRRPASRKCHDCVSTVRSFRHNPSQMCAGASTQFAAKCLSASAMGVEIANAFGNDYKVCKYANSCFEFSESFSCNRGGCLRLAPSKTMSV